MLMTSHVGSHQDCFFQCLFSVHGHFSSKQGKKAIKLQQMINYPIWELILEIALIKVKFRSERKVEQTNNGVAICSYLGVIQK